MDTYVTMQLKSTGINIRISGAGIFIAGWRRQNLRKAEKNARQK